MAAGQIFGARTNTTALLWLTDDRNPIGSDAPARYTLGKTEGCGLDEGVLWTTAAPFGPTHPAR